MITRTALTLVSWLIALPALGQSVGANIGGTVSDETGAVLPDTRVSITHTLNGRRVVATTGARGDYRVVALQTGEYDFTAERTGFAPVTRRIALLVGADATLDFTLMVGGIEARTTVTADIPLVEPRRSQPSSIVTRDDIDAMPVFGTELPDAGTAPAGIWSDQRHCHPVPLTKFGGPADQRAGYTTLIDGGDIDDAHVGQPDDQCRRRTPCRNSKSSGNQFDAQYGHALERRRDCRHRSGTNRSAAPVSFSAATRR